MARKKSAQIRQEYDGSTPGFLEFVEKNIDSVILIEHALSEMSSLLENLSYAQDVVYTGLTRGAHKKAVELIHHNKKVAPEDAVAFEEITEETLKSSARNIYESEKDRLNTIYKEKKNRVGKSNNPSTDIPELILSYNTRESSVFRTLIQKHLNDPRTGESRKKSLQELSDNLNSIRVIAHTSASGSLASLSALSENLGGLLYQTLNAKEKFTKHQNTKDTLEVSAAIAQSNKILTYTKRIFKNVINYSQFTSLLPLSPKSAAKFSLAGFYDGIKTDVKPVQKYRKPNAQKRHEEKLTQKKIKKTYGHYNPSIIEKFKHESGWNEWVQAYNAVLQSYKKTDKRVQEGMEVALSKSSFKSKSQAKLEQRRLVNQYEIGTKTLSYYDRVRAISTASTMWTQANLYRASRYVGSAVRKGAKWVEDSYEQKVQSVSDSEEFKEAAKQLGSSERHKTKNTTKHQKKNKNKGRSR